MSAASVRRSARATWEIAISRDGHGRASAPDEDDALYWLRIPEGDRAALTWELSRELYSLAARNGGVFDDETGAFVTIDGGDLERRLPRAAFVLTRR